MSVYTNEDRFSMTTERYLAKHNVLVYLEDSIAQLLEYREENPKLNPIKILSEYFTSLKDGNHTMFREYQFIHMTPHNRASFVKLFWKCYRQIGKKGDLLSIQEYHSLVTLLCQDFPFEIVQKTAKIILMDDALDCLISFVDFIYAFQAQFYYEEFIDKCLEMYQSMLQTQSSPRNPVVVPSGTEDPKIHTNSHHPEFIDKCLEMYQSMLQTQSSPRNPVVVPSGTEDPKIHTNSHHPGGDGVDAMQFFRAVYPLCDRMNYSTPPSDALKEILFNSPRVSFYGFLMSIAKSDAINEHIGRLPSKAELLEGPDLEIASCSTFDPDRTDAKLPGGRKNDTPASLILQDITSPPPTSTMTSTTTTASKPTSHAAQIRSRSLSRTRNSTRATNQVIIPRTRRKVISSDESSDDSDDDSDDD